MRARAEKNCTHSALMGGAQFYREKMSGGGVEFRF